MSIDSLSQQIERLALEVPKRALTLVKKPELHVGSRVAAIRDLLSRNPEYKLAWPVAERVLQFMDTVRLPRDSDLALNEFRLSLKSVKPRSILTPLRDALGRINESLLPYIWGSEEIDYYPKIRVLNQRDLESEKKDVFWASVKNEKVDKLIICYSPSDGQARQVHPFDMNKSPCIYSGYVLESLVANKVELSALTEKFTLRFDSGETIEELSKAYLSLCGKFFTRNSFQVFRESVNRVIEVRGVSLNGFCGILAMVNMRELDEDIIQAEYIHCKNQLSFCELSNSGWEFIPKYEEELDNTAPLAADKVPFVANVAASAMASPAEEPPAQENSVQFVHPAVLHPQLDDENFLWRAALNVVVHADVVRLIIAHVSNNTFLNCRLVCSGWHKALEIKSAWEKRVFPITISPGRIPQFANFYSPVNYDENEPHWQNLKGRIRDIVTAAKSGDATAQSLIAERVFLRQGSYYIDRNTAFDLLQQKSRDNNEARVDYIFAVDNEARNFPDVANMYFKFSARKGYAKAQNRLGEIYQDGRGVPKNVKKAEKWYLRAAEQGNIDAQVNLASLYYDSNPNEALKWGLIAAQKGSAKAQNRVGCLYYNGKVKEAPSCVEKAFYWFELAAKQGFVRAQCNLANINQDAKNYKEALNWYTIAADNKDAAAQNSLGLLYAGGKGVTKDLAAAANWFLLAAEQNYAAAQYYLGRAHFEGHGIPVDVAEGFKWYLLAAEQRAYDADYKVAQMYREGQGVQENMQEAIKWLHSAADRGNEQACYELGEIYENGKHIPADIKEAFKWYHAAAKKGHMNAQYSVGRLYEMPQIGLNLNKAFYWHLCAADQGHKYAQARVGAMYEHGTGVAKNSNEALKWYRFAALGPFGTSHDKKELENLITKLSEL